MPVTTRSQISGGGDESILRPVAAALRRPPHPPEQEAATAAGPPPLPPSLMRNPHYALKEKMKALTQFYEQHQHQLASVRSLSSRPEKPAAAAGHLAGVKKRGGEGEDDGEAKKAAADLVMRENPLNVMPASSPAAGKKPAAFHCAVESKENLQDRPAAFSCPKKEPPSAARKLSLGGGPPAAQTEPRVLRSKRTSGDLGTISDGGGGAGSGSGSRIMVYVRLRPMAKKEKEAGSRSCVRIVNRREVYLTELTSDTDYLRLKRLRGRHFSFDASFPESTSQQEVYATT